MFIRDVREINAYLPTSVYNDNEGLLSLTEDTEETYILPVIGGKLYEYLDDYYQNICDGSDDVSKTIVSCKSPECKLLRMVQKVIVYLTLANHSGILSVSLNDGGGFNTVSTDGFDKADKDVVSRFERDAFFEGKRGIDRILLFLEADAKSGDPKFLEYWKESDYFYKNVDLLFSTAECFNKYYDISGSREKFVSLQPMIRRAQNAYIAPVLGDELMEAFVAYQLNNDIRVLEGNEDEVQKIWNKATDKLRLALAVRTDSISKGLQKGDLESQADLFLCQAKEYIAKNQEAFMPYIKSSSLYVSPSSESKGEDLPDFNGKNTDDAIFVFMPHLNRH